MIINSNIMPIKADLENIQIENKSFYYRIFDINNHVPNHKYQKWHYHPEIELVFISNGEGKRQVGLHLSNYRDGDLVLIGPNVPHTGFTDSFDEERKEVVIQFKEDFLGNSLSKVFEFKKIQKLLEMSKQGIAFFGKTKKNVGTSMLGLQYESRFQKLITLLKILETLSDSKEYEILNNNKYFSKNIIENERINKVFNYVKQNYKDTVSLKEASELIHMTEPSFCRYFKKHTEKTFTEFVNEYRINNALKLLAQTEIDIKNICYECGYNNFSHFNRLFKKTVKITPSDYRKKIMSSNDDIFL